MNMIWIGTLLLLSGLSFAVTEGLEVQRVVSSTSELYSALSEPSVTTIILSDTLVINGSDWAETISVSRPVLFTATPERLASRVYVYLDFNNTVMMFTAPQGVTLTFRGLELMNHYDMVGPTFRPMRQSVGSTVVFENCVQRRRAGLPYKAALVNMINATRPAGATGPQISFLIYNFTYSSTRSRSPITVPDAISMFDYATTVPPDSSLAYQNLYYGGYTYNTTRSFYIVDHPVSDACMKERPGTECVTLLLQQLDGRGGDGGGSPVASGGGGSAESGGGDSSGVDVTTIVVATVVPSVVVLAAAVGTVLMVRRSRRRQQSRYAGKQTPSDVEAPSGGKGRMPSSLAAAGGGHDSGCVFLGLEENQQLPEWSPLAADLDEDDDDDEDRGDGKAGGGKGGSSLPPSMSELQVSMAAAAAGAGSKGLHSQKKLAAASASDAASCANGTGLMRPALSTQISSGLNGKAPGSPAAGPGAGVGAGKGAASHAAVAGPGAAGKAGVPGDVEQRGGGGAAAGDGGPNGGEAGGGGAAGGGRGSAPTSGVGSAGTVGTDMQAELGRLAQELRANVRDQAIKLEAVIGCGSFGTVYKGTWQGLPVAVKTLVFSASDESRRRALQEAALCASISHPNVVATYASELQPLGTLGAPSSTSEKGQGNSDPAEKELSHILEWRLYIVQEYADGGPLRKLYGNKALWPSPAAVNLPAVVALALGIARALAHLHSKRIIHGDLNPNNVLLKRDPGEPSGYAVKVGDFGLSVMLPHNRTHLSNLRMGTMFYMCPAVVMKGQVGPSSDVFSLGVMLWELYHGRRAGIRTDQGPRYSSIFPAFPPTCPEAYRAVALHCLQRQPQNRPAAALVEAHLEQLLAGLLSQAAEAAAALAAAVGGGGAGAPGYAAGTPLPSAVTPASGGSAASGGGGTGVGGGAAVP